MATLAVRFNSLQLLESEIRGICNEVSQFTCLRRSHGAYAVSYNHPQASKTWAAAINCTTASWRFRATDKRPSPLALGQSPRGITWPGWESRLHQSGDVLMPTKIPADPAGATERSSCTLTFSVVSPKRAKQAGWALPVCGSKARTASVTAGVLLVTSAFLNRSSWIYKSMAAYVQGRGQAQPPQGEDRVVQRMVSLSRLDAKPALPCWSERFGGAQQALFSLNRAQSAFTNVPELNYSFLPRCCQL